MTLAAPVTLGFALVYGAALVVLFGALLAALFPARSAAALVALALILAIAVVWLLLGTRSARACVYLAFATT